MAEETKHSDGLTPEVQEAMRSLITAIRVVKLYPSNNPIYTQSVKKSHEALVHFFEAAPEYHVGVQKTHFSYLHNPVGKDAQLNKGIAQDLFAKGIREILFSSGVTEQELLELCKALALSSEELSMRGGTSTILWEKGTTNVKVTEAGLDDVIKTKTEQAWQDKKSSGSIATTEGTPPTEEQKAKVFLGRTVVLGDLIGDPVGFGFSMLELAMRTCAPGESVEDRLLSLYQEAGRKIDAEHAGESESMFEGLAKSALALEPNFREALISGKLYRDLDTEMAGEEGIAPGQELPSVLQEVQTGRFAHAWTVQQVAALLKKSSTKKAVQPEPPKSPAEMEMAPISKDLLELTKEFAVYTPEETEALENLSNSGKEADIIEAAVRTLIALIPLVKNPLKARPDEEDINLFSGVIHQLEDMLGYLLKDKDYVRATRIIDVFRTPVDPAFKPRMDEALKKTSSKTVITSAIQEMRKHPKNSPEFAVVNSYLSTLERETTEVLLELLAEETDRNARIYYLDMVKEFGKNQIALFAEHLSDGRWYFVRNIVSILGESKADQAIAVLRKAADHENMRIRQEVIKGLLTIGGKKAASVLAKFLRDRETDVQLTAIHAYADFPGISAEEAKPLIDFLEERSITKKENELAVAAIKSLGKIGGKDAEECLKRYDHIRWWKPRALQRELQAVASRSIDEIRKRRSQVNAGQAKQ